MTRIDFMVYPMREEKTGFQYGVVLKKNERSYFLNPQYVLKREAKDKQGGVLVVLLSLLKELEKGGELCDYTVLSLHSFDKSLSEEWFLFSIGAVLDHESLWEAVQKILDRTSAEFFVFGKEDWVEALWGIEKVKTRKRRHKISSVLYS